MDQQPQVCLLHAQGARPEPWTEHPVAPRVDEQAARKTSKEDQQQATLLLVTADALRPGGQLPLKAGERQHVHERVCAQSLQQVLRNA